VGDLPAGLLLARLGRKWTMLLGGCIYLLSTLMLYWVNSALVALACRLLTGFGWALFSVARHAYISSQTDVNNRGRAIALFGGVNRIGRFAGPAIGGMVAAAYGLRAPFLVFGGVCVLVPAAVALFVPRMPHTRVASASHLAREQLLEILKTHRRLLAAAGTGQLLAQAIRAGRRVIIPLYAADVLGLDAGAIGLILSVSSAIDMTLFYPTGVIMDRWGRKVAIVPAFFIQVISLGLVPFAGSFAGLLAAAALGGLGNGLSSGTMMTLGADLAPAEAQGEFLGVWRLVGDAGFSGSPIVVGGIADLVTLQSASWIICGIGLVAVAVFAFLVPETLQNAKPPPVRPT
jgi:MFS family permease